MRDLTHGLAHQWTDMCGPLPSRFIAGSTEGQASQSHHLECPFFKGPGFIWRRKSFEYHLIHANPPKRCNAPLHSGVGTSSGARRGQKLFRCLLVSCAEETYWPGVTPSSRLKRCVKWLWVLKPSS